MQTTKRNGSLLKMDDVVILTSRERTTPRINPMGTERLFSTFLLISRLK